MKRTSHIMIMKDLIMQIALLVLLLVMSVKTPAATINLANAPLADSTQSLVLPNLMYVIDNSGSMDWDFMPDYVDDSRKCKDNSNAAAGSFTWSCRVGHPPYMTKEFNTIYYNPEVVYVPGVDYTGTSLGSMTSANTSGWTAVPTDPYGRQRDDQLGNNRTTISFIPDGSNNEGSGYPDRVWCNTSSPSLADLSNPAVCNANDTYVYPTSTYDEDAIKYTYPYYYTVSPAEYCANENLTSCQATKDAAHPYPARYKWCNSGGACKATYDSNYNRIKWLGVTTAPRSGKIKINATTLSPSAAPSALSVTNVTVAGVRIIPVSPSPALTITDTGNAAQRNTLASNIAANINSYAITSGNGYAATASGDEVTITGATTTSTIAVTSTTANATNSVPVQATGSFRITNVSNWGTQYVSSIRVGGTEILNQTIYKTGGNGSTRRRNLARDIVNRINAYVSSPDYTATTDDQSFPTITIKAVNGGASGNGSISGSYTGGIAVDQINNVSGGGTTTVTSTYNIPVTLTHFTSGTPYIATFNRVDIEPGKTFPKAATRTDCAGATCTYEEEMTNFANWYSYYRTRMQMMKTSTSLAFKDIDSSYRVGYNAINNQSSNYLKISKFDDTHKELWYDELFDTNPSGSTPLRAALSNIGRLYAGKKPFGSSDPEPMQYSCQQNFTLLTTDGYWNGSDSNIRDITGATGVGNQDGSPTLRPLLDGSNVSDTLADVAKYYYDTDLRDGTIGSAACLGSPSNDGDAPVDVCENNVPTIGVDVNNKQHMTTYTLGLGVDGLLTYDSGYKTQTVGDFFDLRNGTINWPVPVSNTQTTVDDLWHAAVNGRGTYFSAKDPNQLSSSLQSTLNGITAVKGIGAAAATSNLNPVPGDNFTYIASYETVNWRGNLEAREIDTSDLEVKPTVIWCIEDTGACQGSLGGRVSTNSDSRSILMGNSGNLVNFTYSNLSATGQASYFDQAYLSTRLSQWSSLSTAQQSAAVGNNLVNYIRGHKGYEDLISNLSASADNRLFRQRLAVLGDIIESKPAYNGVPKASYTDPGYGAATVAGTFAYQQAAREGTIYVGANDGMLHAFDAETGFERWAYVPTPVIENLWKLADKSYSNNHANFVNGSPTINDVCVANCTVAASAEWKTILVSGLNGGGKGYFAMDITDPDAPSLLWEFDSTDDADLGYTYGNPIITKRRTATGEQWVVVFASGYNNLGGANPDKGVLFVLDAATGTPITKYVTTGSGLSKISAVIPNAQKNNLAEQIYGGDIDGNVWRFNINNPPATGNATTQPNPFKFAKLQAPNSIGVLVNQPITTKIEISTVNNKRILFISTGKYLESSDLYDDAIQSTYAITDETYDTVGNTMSTFAPRTFSNGSIVINSSIVRQILSDNANGERVVTSNQVDYSTGKRGWFVDFPESRQRVEIDARLSNGVIKIPTIIPGNSVCSPGGSGELLQLNYKSGSLAAGVQLSTRYGAPLAGITTLYDANGNAKDIIVLRDGSIVPGQIQDSSGMSGFNDHRVIWRELTVEQQ